MKMHKTDQISNVQQCDSYGLTGSMAQLLSHLLQLLKRENTSNITSEYVSHAIRIVNILQFIERQYNFQQSMRYTPNWI